MEPGAGRGAVRMLTLLEELDRQLVFTTTLVYRPTRPGLPGTAGTVLVRVRDWYGDKVELSGPGMQVSLERDPRAGPPAGGADFGMGSRNEWVWKVDFPAGTERPQTLTLRGQVPLQEVREGAWVPDVSLELPAGIDRTRALPLRSQSWVAVAGTELRISAAQGLLVQPDLATTVAAWKPGGLAATWAREAERLRRSGGKLWKAVSDGWSLRVEPVSGVSRTDKETRTQGDKETGGSSSVSLSPGLLVSWSTKVLLVDQQVALVDGKDWLHEAVWWIRQGSPAEVSGDDPGNSAVTIRLPAPAKVLALAVDGLSVQPTPVSGAGSRFWVPLEGAGGVRQVRLRFRYESGAEPQGGAWGGDNPPPTPPLRPLLETPQLEGARPETTLWTVLAPEGFTLRNWGPLSLRTGPIRSVRLLLERAAALEKRLQDLPEKTRKSERQAALGRLARLCQLAEHQLELAGRSAGHDSRQEAQEQALSGRVADLRSRLRREGGDSVPPIAEKQSPAFDPEPFQAGIPYQGIASGEREVPQVALLSERTRQNQLSLAASVEWLSILVLVWILTVVPYLPSLARLLWPEQLLLLAGGLWLLGSSLLLVSSFLVLGLLARLVLLGQWRRRMT